MDKRFKEGKIGVLIKTYSEGKVETVPNGTYLRNKV
jgi:hypothetical protein